MNTPRTAATAVWCLCLTSVCVVVGLLDPPSANVTLAVALLAVVTADATASLG